MMGQCFEAVVSAVLSGEFECVIQVGCAETAHATVSDWELVRELLKNCFVETNAALEIFKRKILIWRMRAAIWQCQAHQ